MIPWFQRSAAREMQHPVGIGKQGAPHVNTALYGPQGMASAMHAGPYGGGMGIAPSHVARGPRGPRKAFEEGGHVGGKDAQGPLTVGPLRSKVPGRTDHIMTAVPANSFVIPSDIVSSFGEGNSEAGHEVLSRYFGTQAGPGHKGVDVALAGGEFVVSPESVAAVGGGNVDVGHKILDSFVRQAREKHIKTLSRLPGPVKK